MSRRAGGAVASPAASAAPTSKESNGEGERRGSAPETAQSNTPSQRAPIRSPHGGARLPVMTLGSLKAKAREDDTAASSDDEPVMLDASESGAPGQTVDDRKEPAKTEPIATDIDVAALWSELARRLRGSISLKNALMAATAVAVRGESVLITFPDDRRHLAEWVLAPTDKRRIEKGLTHLAGRRLGLVVSEETVEVPIEHPAKPLRGQPSAQPDERPPARHDPYPEPDRGGPPARPATQSGSPASAPPSTGAGPDDYERPSYWDADANTSTPSDDYSSYDDEDDGPDMSDEEMMAQWERNNAPAHRRLEAVLSNDDDLKNAVELVQRVVNGRIVRVNGADL